MRTPSYRLHKASGQAVITLNGKDHYLGKHGSPESRQLYETLLAEHQKKAAKERAKKEREEGPSYRLHRASGQAIVTLGGRDHYLGKYDSKESRAKFHRLKAEWLASGKSPAYGMAKEQLTITELLAAWVKHAKAYYGDARGSELHRAKPVIRVVKRLYGTESAIDFGPLQYEAVRVTLLEPYFVKRKGPDGNTTRERKLRSRTYINMLMRKLRAILKWAVSKSLLPVAVYETLRTVEPLRAGRTNAPEREPITPVADALVEATLPHLNHVVRAMVEFQRLVGCRPGEVCQLTPSMVDRSQEVWEIRLERHKTAYKGKSRTIYVGPQAQEVIRPFLLRGPEDYCFSPAEAVKRRRESRTAQRTTPLSCGNKPGSNVKRKPQKQPGLCYNTQSYARSISDACRRNGIESWAPNRLRHSVGTKVRKEFGLEAAQVILGHSDAAITQVYAEVDRAKAIEVARKIG